MVQVVAAALLLAAAAASAAPPLEFPVACKPDVDCWIQNYVDHDPGPGVRDYAAGAMTYDGHRGTDIRLANRARMEQGVAVLAAGPGRVQRTRDGVPDGGKAEHGPGRECGNAVRIDHGEGWVGLYCHLRRGSVRVRPGEAVAAGQPIGEVGLSGMTEFPHLHFELRKDSRLVDPLLEVWKERFPYMALRFFNAGFAAGAAKSEQAAAGAYEGAAIGRDAPALVFWIQLAGVRAGDVISVTLRAPDGSVLATTQHVASRTQAAVFRFVGRKRSGEAWPAGTYVGEASARRDGAAPLKQMVRRETTLK
jgi:hypothetical protein